MYKLIIHVPANKTSDNPIAQQRIPRGLIAGDRTPYTGCGLRSVQLALESLCAEKLVTERKTSYRTFFKLCDERPEVEALRTYCRAIEDQELARRAKELSPLARSSLTTIASLYEFNITTQDAIS